MNVGPLPRQQRQSHPSRTATRTATRSATRSAVGALIGVVMLAGAGDAQQVKVSEPIRLVAGSAPRTATLMGIVKDSLGEPIAYATVYVDGGVATTANDSGRFRLADVPAGRALFGVRRMGYGPLYFTIDMPADTTVSVSIRMHRVVARMREVTVEEKRVSMSLYRAGFYERQKAGVGYFMLPVEIAERAPSKMEELFYGIPGVSVLNVDGRPGVFGLSPSGYCRLSVFVDGKRYQPRGQRELLVDVHDVKAVEIYPRPTETPMQFHDPDNPFCGAIVAWTKID